MDFNYYIITPVKNESKYFEYVAKSVISQTILPVKWIIVDDGSTDNTALIVNQYLQDYPWISLIQLNTKDQPKSFGFKVINAFAHGYEIIRDKEFLYVTKLDADLTLPQDYFEKVGHAFLLNQNLGICGGYICENEEDYFVKSEREDFVQGAIKSVRKSCFIEIGGFWPVNGWDGIDQHIARFNGWEVANLDIKIFHHRPETQDYRSLYFHYQNGRSSYLLGNNYFLTCIRFLFKLFERPHVFGAVAFLYGFIRTSIIEKRMVNKDLALYIRQYHYQRLIKGKR